MKKFLMIFLAIGYFSFGAIDQYQSKFGFGLGLGLPSGYEFKGIYRQNEWLSLSLNYNTLKIPTITQKVNSTGTDMDVTADLAFSTPGVLFHYHPFGGNFRLTGGFLYDMSKFEVNANGTMDIQGISAPVTGNISFKLGRTYPYIGASYGYDFNSVIHLEFTVGAYLVKTPQVHLYFNVADNAVIDQVLATLSGTLSPAQIASIKTQLASSGGNILDLPAIAADVMGLPSNIIMPSEAQLEADMVSVVQQGYDYLPELFGYNLLPMVSFGMVFFPF